MSGSVLKVDIEVGRPFDTKFLLAYLKAREVDGVEEVGDCVYRRSVRTGDFSGLLTVDLSAAAAEGRVRASCSPGPGVSQDWLAGMVEGLVDADAPVAEAAAKLSEDPSLGPLAARRPGIRIPGTVDSFELAVRAIFGQQVSISAARTYACRTAARWGTELPMSRGSISRSFPGPELLVDAPLETIGLSRARSGAVRGLAQAVLDGRVDLCPRGGAETSEASLLTVNGIGPWTAAYVSLRGLRNRDAIPLSDLGLRQALGLRNTREVEQRVEPWRPLRGYGAALLWSTFLPI